MAPQVRRKVNMYRRKHRDKMIFESADVTFSWVGAMIVGGNIVNFRW